MQCIAEVNSQTLVKNTELHSRLTESVFLKGKRTIPGEHCQTKFDNDLWVYWSLLELKKEYPQMIAQNGNSITIKRELIFNQQFKERLESLYQKAKEK
jgi:hypothetical protein